MKNNSNMPEGLMYPHSESPLRVEPVAAYVRVSHTEQKLHGLSLDAQRMKLTEYAESHGMRIVEWYVDEGVSGRKLIRKRPELQRMIRDAEAGKFDRIIFIKLDRFFRSVAEYHECMKRIAPVTWTTTEEKYDLTTAQGRMLVNMKLTIAEMEADQTGERINIVNDYKTTTGQPLTGSMPFGFLIAKDETTGRKKIIRHPEHEDIMEELLEYVQRHQSKRKAVQWLQAKGIFMDYNTLSKLLKNTMLCGEYRGNQNYCESYLTREEFDKLQAITKRNVKENTANRTYFFSGLVRCPNCGRRLSGNIYRCNKGGRTYKYKRYRCLHHMKNSSCNFNKAVNEATLERAMLNQIEGLLESAKIKNFKISESDAVKVPKHNVEELHSRIDRLNYSWQTGKIRKVEQYEEEYAKLLELLEEAERELAETTPKDFSQIEEVLKSGWEGIYTALDAEHKRAFWRSIISGIDIEWTDEKKKIIGLDFL